MSSTLATLWTPTLMDYEIDSKHTRPLLPVALTELWRLASEYVAYAGIQ